MREFERLVAMLVARLIGMRKTLRVHLSSVFPGDDGSDNDDNDGATVAATVAARAARVVARRSVGWGARLVATDLSPHFAAARLGAAFAVKGATERCCNGAS